LFAKRLLSYVANLRLQNDTKIDHVRLEPEVQRPFKKDPLKTFKAPYRKIFSDDPKSCNSIHGVLSMCQTELKNFARFLSYLP